MMARQPRWAEALLSLRNLLVAPLGPENVVLANLDPAPAT